MELFSLGVGNYTEKDVREAARAFTGWRTDGERFRFDARSTTAGPRQSWDRPAPGMAATWCVSCSSSRRRPAFWCASSISFLVSEKAHRPTPCCEPLCESFRKSDYDIACLVRTMLSSRHFYSAHAFRQRIKGPVEYVLGAVRAVYRRYAEGEADFRPLPQELLVGPISAMGQQLFAPPNVKGWPGGAHG